MKRFITKLFLLTLVISLTLLSACNQKGDTDVSTPDQGSPVAKVTSSLPPKNTDPLSQVDTERMFRHLEKLTSIQPYSGWRNSATLGELEAQEYVASTLKDMNFLNSSGLTIERQEFHVFLSTEQWTNGLEINLGGKIYSIPAQGMRGNRDSISAALRFDSDGKLNDSRSDPMIAEGSILEIKDEAALNQLTSQEVSGKILFVNFDLVDSGSHTRDYAGTNAARLLNLKPNGIVLITENGFEPGGSHGTFSYDGSSFQNYTGSVKAPVLIVRLEDIQAQGIDGWKSLPQANAKVTWDADVFSPGTSHNLAAFIPGQNHEKAIIISAHIDSANGPGAMDDGSGSVILLEIAEVLNSQELLPAYDLYLVWYGSEEIGLYGSSHFVNTHTDLLARTIAMLQIDCLVRPLDTLHAGLMFNYSSDPGSEAWADYLQETASQLGYQTSSINMPLASDNGPYTGYDIPNIDLILEGEELNSRGGVWYNGHIHDPYDQVEMAREMKDELEQMAKIALSVALLPADVPAFRVNTAPDKHAVILSTHNEADHMTPSALADLGMVLAKNGYEVTMIPYGQTFTGEDLQDANLVITLPVMDYPSAGWDESMYDEAWKPEEIKLLQDYVKNGGHLVITNSATRLKFYNLSYEPNEDWSDANPLAEPFGAEFISPGSYPASYTVKDIGGITTNIDTVKLVPGNLVPIKITNGKIVAGSPEAAAIALVDFGKGQVLFIGDLGMLASQDQAVNEILLNNLANLNW